MIDFREYLQLFELLRQKRIAFERKSIRRFSRRNTNDSGNNHTSFHTKSNRSLIEICLGRGKGS